MFSDHSVFSKLLLSLVFIFIFFFIPISCRAEAFPPDFILGVDVSELIAQENSGVVYYDGSGAEADALKILADYGAGGLIVDENSSTS